MTGDLTQLEMPAKRGVVMARALTDAHLKAPMEIMTDNRLDDTTVLAAVVAAMAQNYATVSGGK